MLALRESSGFTNVGAVVRCAAIQCEGNSCNGFAGGDRLHAADHVLTASLKFPTELSHQSSGAFRISTFKRMAGEDEDNPGDTSYGYGNCQREDGQQLAPEAHGFSAPNQTSSRCHVPSRSDIQFLTFAPRPSELRTCSKGIMRFDCSKAASAA